MEAQPCRTDGSISPRLFNLELVYKNDKVKMQCTSVKAAKKLFGGNASLVTSLLARVNALKNAKIIKDIIVIPNFHFHSLENKGRKILKGYYAIDVKPEKMHRE